MKVAIQGYEVEGTPLEIDSLIALQHKEVGLDAKQDMNDWIPEKMASGGYEKNHEIIMPKPTNEK